MRSLVNRSAFSAAAASIATFAVAAGPRRLTGDGSCAPELDLHPSWRCEAEIRAIPERGIVSAWDARDAAAFAARFSEDASYILSEEGLHLTGRHQIRVFTAYRLAKLHEGARMVEEVVDVTCVSRNAAVVVTRGGIVLPGEAAVSPLGLVRSTWVIARERGEWLVTAYHDSRVTPVDSR